MYGTSQILRSLQHYGGWLALVAENDDGSHIESSPGLASTTLNVFDEELEGLEAPRIFFYEYERDPVLIETERLILE
jgi:hypothetical protein